MNATNIQTQWGKVLLVLAAIGAVMGAMLMISSPASAHHSGGTSSYTTSPTVCVPTDGQPYIAPTVIHHDAVTHTEWKYEKHGGEGHIWVDNDTYKYVKNGVGTNTKPSSGTYYERTEDTRTVTDHAAWDEVTNPGQPYIAPVVCDTTSTTSTTSTSTTTTSTTTTSTTTTEACPEHWGWSEAQQTCVIVECDEGWTPNDAGDGCDPVTSTTTTTTTSTTTTSPPVDVCPNIDGVQETVPDGYLVNNDGNCYIPETSTTTTTTTTTTSPPVDMCLNIDGVQETVPDGYLVNNDGFCYIPETSTTTTTTTTSSTTTDPVDVCPNIDGDQATIPDGYFLADNGDCVQDETLGVSSSDSPTPTLTEVTLAATGAGGTTGGVALALSLILGGLGVMLLRRQVSTEV